MKDEEEGAPDYQNLFFIVHPCLSHPYHTTAGASPYQPSLRVKETNLMLLMTTVEGAKR